MRGCLVSPENDCSCGSFSTSNIIIIIIVILIIIIIIIVIIIFLNLIGNYSKEKFSLKVFSRDRYTVNELGRWEMEFGVHVKTFDQVLEKKNNVTKAKWIPGGEIVIGPHVRMGRGKYGRVS